MKGVLNRNATCRRLWDSREAGGSISLCLQTRAVVKIEKELSNRVDTLSLAD